LHLNSFSGVYPTDLASPYTPSPPFFLQDKSDCFFDTQLRNQSGYFYGIPDILDTLASVTGSNAGSNPNTGAFTFSGNIEVTDTQVSFKIPGYVVRRLVDGRQPAGYMSVYWNGFDDHGRRVAPGVYYCRFRAGDYRAVQKLVVRR
jgi:hypothetical protein